MNILKKIVGQVFCSAIVLDNVKISNHSYHLRIRLHTPFKSYSPCQQLKIFIDPGTPSLIRTYSVWQYDEIKQEADLAICDFSDGPGAHWIRKVQTGDTIYFDGPTGSFVADSSEDNYLFIGDVASLGHFYEIARVLKDKIRYGFIYSADSADFFADFDPAIRFQFIEERNSPMLKIAERLDELTTNKDKTIVYIAGNQQFCKEVVEYFTAILKWDRSKLRIKPFWSKK